MAINFFKYSRQIGTFNFQIVNVVLQEFMINYLNYFITGFFPLWICASPSTFIDTISSLTTHPSSCRPPSHASPKKRIISRSSSSHIWMLSSPSFLPPELQRPTLRPLQTAATERQSSPCCRG